MLARCSPLPVLAPPQGRGVRDKIFHRKRKYTTIKRDAVGQASAIENQWFKENRQSTAMCFAQEPRSNKMVK